METVTLGITTYCGPHLLDTCLQSIRKSVKEPGYSNFEVVVVDDGSPNRISRMLKRVSEKFDFVKHFREQETLGNVARYNTIVEKSSGDIVFLIDNDLIVPDRWFCSALHFLTSNKCGVAGYLSEKVNDKQVKDLMLKKRITAEGSGRPPERATELAGYCFGFKRENYDLIGGFDSDNFKYFLGDSDFCCRLAKKGLMSYRLLYPMVYHREHATYDAYKHLDAWKRVKQDQENFKKKWGASSKEIEQKFLDEIKPQQITWYAYYAVKYDWDVEQPFQMFKKPVRVMDYKDVPPDYRGA